MAEAIEYGRTQVVPLVPAPGGGAATSSAAAADRELLEDATALLAYDDPATGPTGGQLVHGWLRCCTGEPPRGAGPCTGPLHPTQKLGSLALLRATPARCIPSNPLLAPLPLPPSLPPGYLLTPAHRAELAAELNRAILVHSGRSEDSALEAILRQATAALQVGAGQAAWGGGGVLSGWLPCSQALLTLRLVQHGELLVLWPTAPAFIFCCTQCAGVEAKRAPRGAAAGCADAAAAAAGAAAAGRRVRHGSRVGRSERQCSGVRSGSHRWQAAHRPWPCSAPCPAAALFRLLCSAHAPCPPS